MMQRRALRLVGAGLPRTGTSSLREALRHLLGGSVHHMSEVFAHPEQAPVWAAAIRGEPPHWQWQSFLSGYVAAVDSPASNCWRQVAATFHDVPVLLSTRKAHRCGCEVCARRYCPAPVNC